MTVLNKIGATLSKVWKTITLQNVDRASEFERYLNGAQDVHELEARERAWARRMQHRHY